MLGNIPRVGIGQGLSASRENEIADLLNRLRTPIVDGPTENVASPESVFLDLYEVTVGPEQDEDSKEYFVMAKPVFHRWCTVDDDGHWVADAYKSDESKPRARRYEDAEEEKVWVVANHRDVDNQEPTKAPMYSAGDRVIVAVWAQVKIVIDRQQELSYSQIVTVTNKTEEDWGLYDIVGVAYPQNTPVTDGPSWFSGMSFEGYRLDRGAYPNNVGVTQEPIAAGKSGRVCIRGITLALQCKYYNYSYSWQSGWVHVWKASGDTPRWMFYRGPAGEARMLGFIQSDYTDDQHLILIDLCEVPNRVPMANYSGGTLAPHSHCVGDDVYLKTVKSGNWSQTVEGYPFTLTGTNPNHQGYITPGYSIPQYGWAWCYRVTEGCPVCVEAQDISASLGINCSSALFGPVIDQTRLWYGVPGFWSIGYQVYRSGEYPYSPDATPPSYFWFMPSPEKPFLVKAHDRLSSDGLSSDYANVCIVDHQEYIYDGTTQGGVEFPVVLSQVQFGSAPRTSGGYVARYPNVQKDQYFYCVFGKYKHFFSPADASVWDDPIGTVKMWVGTTSNIPPGWRQYSAMSSRVPFGSNSTGTGSLIGAAGSGFSVDYANIVFIERYQ